MYLPTKPALILTILNRVDPESAVRLANSWGTPEVTPQQYDAGWRFIERQTVFPHCVVCRWAAIPGEAAHTSCEQEAYPRSEKRTGQVTLLSMAELRRPAGNGNLAPRLAAKQD